MIAKGKAQPILNIKNLRRGSYQSPMDLSETEVSKFTRFWLLE